jgi:polyribonucleotide nucleotidyltransferase
MIPVDCPYTIRVVSEVLESNGSSSMATVLCWYISAYGCWYSIDSSSFWNCNGTITDGDRYIV